ncbi:MAG TPA: L,D-transpeptidase family protein [Dongiaceae bacterium]|nr:L,D-transpeptidase family protein [Dongiaceae bacterium]
MRRFLLVLIAVVAVAAPVAAAPDMAAALRLRLDVGAAATDSDVGDRDLVAVRRFYAERGFQPVWVDSTGATARAKAIVDAIEGAAVDGLDPADYDAAAIAERLGAVTPEDRVDLEVRLSRALVQFANDLHAGRVVPGEIDSGLFVYPQRIDAIELLSAAVAAPDVGAYLAGLAPSSPEYLRLKQALADYSARAAAGGWSRFPEGETLKPGMRGERVPLLRRRLVEAGDLPPAEAESDLFDAPLEDAVRRFQRRHGLTPDGAVGRMTTAALNVPLAARIDQMLLNMERRRWMPRDLGTRYVFVNMADFELKVVDGPKTVHDDRVVVGTPYQQTPEFSEMMTYIVVNPYWNIPPSIAGKEMLPKIRKDVGYLARNRIEVLSDWSESGRPVDPATIDWSRLSARHFPYKLRQQPGGDNALGRLKFMFPNRFNIYLHDTPARALFERTVRSFSHGCIRVQHPVDLAAVLLDGADGWTKDRIEAAIATGKRQVISLPRPLPVHLTYLTAWVNKDGTVNFRDDIYGRDASLARALGESRAPRL